MTVLILILSILGSSLKATPCIVISSNDNIVTVQTEDGNIWEYAGETDHEKQIVLFYNDAIVNAF